MLRRVRDLHAAEVERNVQAWRAVWDQGAEAEPEALRVVFSTWDEMDALEDGARASIESEVEAVLKRWNAEALAMLGDDTEAEAVWAGWAETLWNGMAGPTDLTRWPEALTPPPYTDRSRAARALWRDRLAAASTLSERHVASSTLLLVGILAARSGEPSPVPEPRYGAAGLSRAELEAADASTLARIYRETLAASGAVGEPTR